MEMNHLKMKNYLVLWRPVSDWWPSTVESMRVVDAFKTDGGMIHAKHFAEAKADEYAAKYGQGECQVVLSSEKQSFALD